MTGGTDDLALLGRVMGGLIVVIMLIGLIAKVTRRTRGQRGDSGLRIIDRIGLSREANLAVVEVSNRLLLLGVTARGVTMLANLDDDGERDPAVTGTTRRADPPHDDAPEEAPVYAVTDSISDLTVTHTIRPTGRRRRSGLVELGLVVEGPEVDDGLVDVVGSDLVDVDHGDLVDVVGSNRATSKDRGRPIPAGIALDEYPDLAAALRAAGRIAGPVADDGSSEEGQAAGPAVEPVPLAPPRTRAEARARRAANGAAHLVTAPTLATPPAPTLAPTPPRAPTPDATRVPRPAPTPARPRIPLPRTGPTPSPRVAPPTPTQASGSVLSPKTWRQGIETLRELTVRRG